MVGFLESWCGMIKDTILGTILMKGEHITLYKHIYDDEVWFSYHLFNSDSSNADDDLSNLLSELAIDIQYLIENS